ncbi:PDZ and LIM domain protein Zasp isoform X19 [Lutzomyia longipalpis]|uniref:PDZ and LIM domain protein Zasp isoform X19 n=1 Tax=Lutzomyia longipalpis TaxID=7200 RepID=UPI0024843708|nr:PDZ and LIM domain protein Zasp isoform X19 [Lutzomyia longipalpis]
MAQLVTVRLSRSDAQPWGFRLQGGKDFGTPLVVQKVAGGSIAANAGLVAGDAVIKVNGMDVYNLRHKDAQDAVVRGGNNFEISVQRGGSTWRPTVSPAGSLPQPVLSGGSVAPVTHTSLAAKPQEVSHIGSGYNSSARPYLPSVNGDGVKSIVNKQYNTPVGMYSDETIAETLSAQAEVLAGGVLGVNFKKNERIYNSANSEVYKMLQEAENDPNDPEESSFSPTPYQSSNQQSSPSGGVTKHVTAPVAQAKPPNTGGLPAGQNICAECERLIVGVFVRIKEKNLHVDCFKCATCGTPLKNQGYFNINNKLYCDIHAKLAALNNPPPGTEGYLPVPIKPNTKLSASTISAALTTHHGTGAGATNGAPQLGSPLSTGSNINTNISGPKPFNISSAPLSPPSAGPKSPSIYPPPTSAAAWSQPKPPSTFEAPKPSTFGSSTLPRANVGPAAPVSPRHETPSEMLEKSIQNLKISDKETFRVKAGEVISGMLQARLDGGKKTMDINQNRVPTTNGYHGDTIPQKDLPHPPQSTDDTDKSTDIIRKSSPPAVSNGHENGTSESTLNDVVRYRNKPNKNLKPELISHARDRRSYIEKENQITNDPPKDHENNKLNPEEIATNLENGVHPVCCVCDKKIARGPFITALGRIWCPDHFICVNGECRRPLADIGFVEEKGNLYCEYCFEKYIAPSCSKCGAKIKGDCLNAIGKHFHPECFTCAYCGKLFGNSPFFLEEGNPYCEADWNEMFTTKCFACGFPVEAGDRWVEALSHNYHSQCFNCTTCKKNLEGQSFFAKGGRPYCKNHAR